MTAGFKKTASVLLVSLFTLTCPVMAADPGGGGDDDGSSISTTYIVIGVAVVLGGLLFLDVLADSGDDTSDESDENAGIDSTGVNWDEVATTEAVLVHVAVSTFPGENGTTLSREFINTLSMMVSDEIAVYSDPLDLGEGSAISRAGIAKEYFGVDYLICCIETEDVFQFEAASPESIIWTSHEQIDIDLVGIIEDMLQAGIF